MAFINYMRREIHLKIVYWGPAMAGKATTLQFVFDRTPAESRDTMTSMEMAGGRMMFFGYEPQGLGQRGGLKTRLVMPTTLSGPAPYDAAYGMVLRNADAVVFVADSQAERLAANREALAALELGLAQLEYESTPLVFQYNKRDLPDASPIAELELALNSRGRPSFESVATNGVGVFEALKVATELALAAAPINAAG